VKKVLLGIIREDGCLLVDSKKFLLTRLTRDEAKRIGPMSLPVEKRMVGRLLLVSGDLFKKTLYQTEILEEVSSLSGALIKALLRKGIISQDDILDNLARSQHVEPQGAMRLCALVIGHKKMSPGAVNEATGLSEFDFNDHLSIMIEKRVKRVLVQRVYRRTLAELPDDINSLDPDFVVSLHCNAFDTKASGTEVLYYHRSKVGEKLAQILIERLVAQLHLPNRGIKPKTAEDRGGYLLCYTKAPVVLAEPFFIDNDRDLEIAQSDLDGLATAYATAIHEVAGLV